MRKHLTQECNEVVEHIVVRRGQLRNERAAACVLRACVKRSEVEGVGDDGVREAFEEADDRLGHRVHTNIYKPIKKKTTSKNRIEQNRTE